MLPALCASSAMLLVHLGDILIPGSGSQRLGELLIGSCGVTINNESNFLVVHRLAGNPRHPDSICTLSHISNTDPDILNRKYLRQT